MNRLVILNTLLILRRNTKSYLQEPVHLEPSAGMLCSIVLKAGYKRVRFHRYC